MYFAKSVSMGTSLSIVANSFDILAISLLFSMFSRALFFFICSVLFKMFSISPNCSNKDNAVFSPIPGTPGMLSEASPIKPFNSTTCSGVMLYCAINFSLSNSSVSLIPFLVINTCTLELIN